MKYFFLLFGGVGSEFDVFDFNFFVNDFNIFENHAISNSIPRVFINKV